MAGCYQGNNGYSKGKQGPGWNQNQQKATLPDGYLKGGYYEKVGDETRLNPKYIVKYPKDIAKNLSDWDESAKGKKNKRSQIRKFYDYTLRIQELLDRKSGNFALIEGELDRLLPYVNYAKNRDKPTVSDLFVSFIEENVNAVHNAEDMRAFVKHFEALIAYLPKEKN